MPGIRDSIPDYRLKLHTEHLQGIVKKAEDESKKVEEVAFITELSTENKKLSLVEKLNESERRRAMLLEERVKKARTATKPAKTEHTPQSQPAQTERLGQPAQVSVDTSLDRDEESPQVLVGDKETGADRTQAALLSEHECKQEDRQTFTDINQILGEKETEEGMGDKLEAGAGNEAVKEQIVPKESLEPAPEEKDKQGLQVKPTLEPDGQEETEEQESGYTGGTQCSRYWKWPLIATQEPGYEEAG